MNARWLVRAGVAVMLAASFGSQWGCSASVPTTGEAPAAPGAPAADFQVTLEPSSVSFAVGEEIALTISIVNFGNETQIWGQGSSYCRLTATVMVDGERLPTGPPVACTMDMVQYRLAPAAVDTQTWRWDGSVLRLGLVEKLPPGIYDVYGRGGDLYSSSVIITLRP